MRQLLLLRHAKSSSGDASLPDRQRPLAPRGERDAALMAAAIVARGLLPDRVLCSPARRTRETLAALRPKLERATEIVFSDALYEPQAPDYRATIAAAAGDARRMLVIAHNPATHATALALAGAGDRALRARLAGKFPTGALAVIAFSDGDWPALLAGTGRLAAFLRPRDLADDDGDD